MEIRRLRRDDGPRLREVRLRALEDAPYAFSSSLERESGLGRASKPADAMYRKLGFAETGEREPLEWNPSLIARVLSRSFRAI